VEIIQYFDTLTYLPATYFAYDAAADVINYDDGRLEDANGRLCLLHETAHALLGHVSFEADIELFVMELRAWQKTRELAALFDVAIDQVFVTDCLASYEQWLTARATCPDCANFCLNKTMSTFACWRCGCQWRVNDRRDCAVRRWRIGDSVRSGTQKPA